jgi:hypothetical protein
MIIKIKFAFRQFAILRTHRPGAAVNSPPAIGANPDLAAAIVLLAAQFLVLIRCFMTKTSIRCARQKSKSKLSVPIALPTQSAKQEKK